MKRSPFLRIPAQRRTLKRQFDDSPQQVRSYLEHLPELLARFPLDVSLSYLFTRVEQAHNQALYCGVVKLHGANRDIARSAIDSHHLTRNGFREQFRVVFGDSLPEEVKNLIQSAETVRDKVMHGKKTLEREKRQAIAGVLRYAGEFNKVVSGLAGFQPFGGELRGFKGRGKALNRATTKWVMKGMGFGIP